MTQGITIRNLELFFEERVIYLGLKRKVNPYSRCTYLNKGYIFETKIEEGQLVGMERESYDLNERNFKEVVYAIKLFEKNLKYDYFTFSCNRMFVFHSSIFLIGEISSILVLIFSKIKIFRIIAIIAMIGFLIFTLYIVSYPSIVRFHTRKKITYALKLLKHEI